MIDNKLFNSANEICRIIQNAGFNAYFVGGCVRDTFMNIEPHDIDITTNALPASIQKLFSNHIDTGLKHGTVSVKLNKEDSFFEVTTFRIDGEYKDGRHPENVVFVNTVEDDLSRRDFTINAIAYDPVSMLFIDPFNGKTDIVECGYCFVIPVKESLDCLAESGVSSGDLIRLTNIFHDNHSFNLPALSFVIT